MGSQWPCWPSTSRKRAASQRQTTEGSMQVMPNSEGSAHIEGVIGQISEPSAKKFLLNSRPSRRRKCIRTRPVSISIASDQTCPG
jgi:hypothetical protein